MYPRPGRPSVTIVCQRLQVDAISQRADRHDVPRMRGIGFEQTAQACDMGVHRARLHRVGVPPHVAEQLEAGDDSATPAQQG